MELNILKLWTAEIPCSIHISSDRQLILARHTKVMGPNLSSLKLHHVHFIYSYITSKLPTSELVLAVHGEK